MLIPLSILYYGTLPDDPDKKLITTIGVKSIIIRAITGHPATVA
jgi:hypothetical protein